MIKIKAYAKINLSLDVKEKMENGYHNIESVMQSISLYDVVTLQGEGLKSKIQNPKSQEISVSCNNPDIPVDESNLAYKAASILSKEHGLKKGVHISLTKNIPVGSGLAGGSTDAAAVLRGLNRLWDLNLNAEELRALGALVGADVPFCLKGGSMLATGIGDRLKPISVRSTICYVLVSPSLQISTKETYSKFDGLAPIPRRPNTAALIAALEEGDVERIASNLGNVLEEVTLSEHRELSNIKGEMIKAGALGALMSGSGSSIFGLTEGEEDAKSICARLRDRGLDAYVVSSQQEVEDMF